jgi:hypothetical protein
LGHPEPREDTGELYMLFGSIYQIIPSAVVLVGSPDSA